MLCWPYSYWFGIGEAGLLRTVLDRLCRLDLHGREPQWASIDLLVSAWQTLPAVMQGYSLAILSITGSSNTSRALLRRVIISGSPPLSGWCWTASNLWACFTCSAFKRPVKGSPRLWRALMASSSGSRPNGHCSRRWLAFPGFRLAFDALDRLLAAVPKPLDPLVLLVKRLLVTDWRDCKITSECLSAIQRWRMRWPRSFARVDQISSIRCLAVNVTELRQVKTFNPAQVDRWIDWPSQSCKINPERVKN